MSYTRFSFEFLETSIRRPLHLPTKDLPVSLPRSGEDFVLPVHNQIVNTGYGMSHCCLLKGIPCFQDIVLFIKIVSNFSLGSVC